MALELWGKQKALSCLSWPKKIEGGMRLFVSESDWPTESGSPEVGTARRLPPEDRHIERDVKYFGEQLTRACMPSPASLQLHQPTKKKTPPPQT